MCDISAHLYLKKNTAAAAVKECVLEKGVNKLTLNHVK